MLKPNDEYGGKGVMLAWETPLSQWDAALESALQDPPGSWIVQERIAVRREVFPQFDDAGHVSMRDMLVNLAPYLFAEGSLAIMFPSRSARSSHHAARGDVSASPSCRRVFVAVVKAAGRIVRSFIRIVGEASLRHCYN